MFNDLDCKEVILVKYGEIAIRKKNRYIFEGKLIKNIYHCLEYPCKITKEQGRLLIEVDDFNYIDEIIDKISNVFGVAGVCRCIKLLNQEIESICSAALIFMKQICEKQGAMTFKIETRRAMKKYPMTSHEISAKVGEYLLRNLSDLKVDVHKPDVLLNIELRNSCYIYCKTVSGFGGLPIGSTGKGILLLSGGIDSPVAGFLTAKRGVEVECVYFHSPPYVSPHAKQKVFDLAQRLSLFAGDIFLHVVPFTDIQLYLHDNVPEDKLTIFLKRAMLNIAEAIALRRSAQAVITGDSLGQVASQTLQSIQAVNSACELPIIRPLAGFNKQEIVDLSKKIGTYDISIEPYDDCCTLFVAKHPETRPLVSAIEKIESNLPGLKDKIDNALLNIEINCIK